MTTSGVLHAKPDHKRFVEALGNHDVRAAIADAPSADVANQPYQYIAGPSDAG